MEPRKRPLPDEDDYVVTKKRILTGANGSPHVNGVLDEDEEDALLFREKLELYRKEAIYRKMKHYSREHERSKVRIQELERRKTTCEAGAAAIAACWAQLVETIRVLVKTDDIPDSSIHAKDIFDLTTHIHDNPTPEFSAALADTVNATQSLLTKFVQLGGDKNSNILHSKSFPECQKAQNECAVLQTELNLLRTKLHETESQKETYYNALIAAENRYERSLSSSVHDVESRKGKAKDQEGGTENEEVQRQPSSPAPSSVTATPTIQQNGFHDSSEVEVLTQIIQSRDAKIVELEKEAALLRDEKTMLALEHNAPTAEQLMQNPHYKALVDYIAHLEPNLAEKSALVEDLRKELVQAHPVRVVLEDASTSSAAQTIQELKSMVSKRDVENARLRDQREQQNAELVERRHKDNVKFSSIQEYKTLLETNSERIKVLQVGVRRCKAQLAANAGATDLLSFFMGGEIDEAKFFETVKEQKAQLEKRVAALEQTLVGFDAQHPDIARHMKAEADALERLSQVNAELEDYHRIFGESSSLPPEVSQLADQLRYKDVELERLRMSERQYRETEASLYSELEQLSTVWEALDRQVKSKVLDLSNMEERLVKHGEVKAKSDNKYFSAMREKDAIDSERRTLKATLEKQNQVLDHQRGIYASLQTQHNISEQENTALKKGTYFLTSQVWAHEKEISELKAQLETEKQRFQELTALISEREADLRTKRAELRNKEDEFIRSKKELEKQMAQVKRTAKSDTAHGNSKNKDLDAATENAQKLIMCSTCHTAVRSTVITKCMHTFCRGCVDARLSTRQRRCPSCNLPFGASDVHHIFLQ